jgi:hypothetical protein
VLGLCAAHAGRGEERRTRERKRAREERAREGERKREKETGRAGRDGLGWLLLFFPLFFFFTLPIQTKPFEFKYNLNSNLYTSTQIKQCCGMNAQTF